MQKAEGEQKTVAACSAEGEQQTVAVAIEEAEGEQQTVAVAIEKMFEHQRWGRSRCRARRTRSCERKRKCKSR